MIGANADERNNCGRLALVVLMAQALYYFIDVA